MLRDACMAAGFPAQFPVVGTLLGIVCGDVPAPVDFAGAKRTDEAAYVVVNDRPYDYADPDDWLLPAGAADIPVNLDG